MLPDPAVTQKPLTHEKLPNEGGGDAQVTSDEQVSN